MTRRNWTKAEVTHLREHYPHRKTADIAAELGRNTERCYQKAAALGLRKTAEFLSSTAACRLRRGDGAGAATRFKPGQQPWNKGTHFVAGGRSAETQFKPGVRQGVAQKLYQPIGTERISKDGYRERKINDDMPLQKRWRAVHIINWEAVNGPLPQGHALVFKDGDKTHVELDNLELITRAELMRRNTVHNLPKPLAEIVQLRGAITRQINKYERKTA